MTDINRLKWRCRRGLREMDLVFEHFIDEHYAKVSPELQAAFERMSDELDLDIYDWLMGRADPPDEEIAQVLKLMLKDKPTPDSN